MRPDTPDLTSLGLNILSGVEPNIRTSQHVPIAIARSRVPHHGSGHAGCPQALVGIAESYVDQSKIAAHSWQSSRFRLGGHEISFDPAGMYLAGLEVLMIK